MVGARLRLAVRRRRARRRTRRGRRSTWALGRGLIRVGAAYDWLVANADEGLADVRFRVKAAVTGSGAAQGSRGRGVHCASRSLPKGDVTCAVSIKPELHEDEPNKEKLTIDIPVALTTSAPWLSCAPSLALTYGGKGFDLKVGCASLPPGAHFAEVLGTDTTHAGLGALFRVPVTVIKPHADLLSVNGGCSYAAYESLPFTPGHIERRFVVPPAGATWATVVLEVRGAPRSREADGGQTIFMLHTTQLLPSKRIQEWSTRVSLGLPKEEKAPSTQYVHSVAVTGGVTMEVTVAQWWMALGDTEASLKVDFHGVSPLPAALALDGRTLFTEFQLHSSVRRTPVEPAGKLTTLERAVRPHSAKLLLRWRRSPARQPLATRGPSRACSTTMCSGTSSP